MSLVVAVVAVFLHATPDSSGEAPVTSDTCPSVTRDFCFSIYHLQGKPGKLPTRDDFLASIAVNDHLVAEWYLHGPAPSVTMPRLSGYIGFLLQGGCIGSGRLILGVDSDGLTITLPCDESIGPGWGFPVIEGDGPQTAHPMGPFVIQATTVGQVTDAEFFVTGERA